MSRATGMERIEKLRLQLEEAERKIAETEAKKQAAKKEQAEKKRTSLTARLDRLFKQQAKVNEMIEETQSALDDIDNEFGAPVQLEVVTDDDAESSDVA